MAGLIFRWWVDGFERYSSNTKTPTIRKMSANNLNAQRQPRVSVNSPPKNQNVRTRGWYAKIGSSVFRCDKNTDALPEKLCKK
jgi:hypothetical protein